MNLAMGKGGAINRRKDRGKKKAAAPKAEEPLDWVQCTGCDKWRRIPASIVEKLGEEDEWFCKENPDKAMASCDAPEEAYDDEDPADAAPMEVDDSSLGWVACDACQKWRRIPASIVDALGEQDKWFCKDNPDKNTASCDAPEEAYEDDAADPAETEPMETEPTPSRVHAADPAPAKTPAAVTFAPDTAPAPAPSPPNLDLAPHQPAPSAPPATGEPKPETPVPIDETLQGSAYGDSTGWRRPPLSRCTPEDFMLDFMRFTDSQGDDWEVVWDILDNSLRRSGRPMDALGFYKEICWRGGFVNRESAKKRIKMPDVFKQLHNHYVNHTYTDIGNNLLNTYERYFWAYERAHPEDVSNQRCVTCEQDRVEKPGQMLRCDGCGDWHHAECAAFDPTDSGIVRGVVEIVTSFVCVRCRDAARKDPKRLIAFESERVTREDLEDRMKHRAEENFTRHLAMQRRRGRRYDPSFVRPTRDPDALANKTTGKYDDKPIGTWAAAKNYVPPKNHEAVPDRTTAKKSEEDGERRPNLLDDGWVPATVEGRAVFGLGSDVGAAIESAARDAIAKEAAAVRAARLAKEPEPWVAGRAEAEWTGDPKPDMTTVGEWLAAQGKLHVSDPAATLVLNRNLTPAQVDAMRAAGDAAFKEASAKFGASTAAATAAKEQPPPEPHPQETFQKVAGPLITHIVDGVKTTLPADEFRARRDGTAPTPPARLHDPDAKYPGKVLNDGMVQIAGPIWGYGFNAAEANAMAAQLHKTGDVNSKEVAERGAPAIAIGIPIKPMPADYGKEKGGDGEIMEEEEEEEAKASEEPAGPAPAGPAQ